MGGFWLNPNRRMYRYIVSAPTLTATSANTVLTEFVSASVRVIVGKSSPPEFCRGTPEIFLLFLPLIRESGVYLPVSRPAVAVTTLNVDPGGYRACVERLKRPEPCSLPRFCAATTPFGSYDGTLAMTSTLPVDGSKAT